jgi:hypothetical protein
MLRRYRVRVSPLPEGNFFFATPLQLQTESVPVVRLIEIVFDRCVLLSAGSSIVVHVFDRTPVRTIE